MTTFTGSVNANLAAIVLTPTATAAGFAAGTNLANLLANLEAHLVEANEALIQVLKIHPSTGPDASNYAALQAVQAELFP